MKDLKCGMRDCVHNESYCCCAKNISVDHYTDCTTYEKSAKRHENILFEAGVDFAPSNYNVDTNVKCTAPCLFNRNNICIANGITVLGEGNNEALCMTFIKDEKANH